MALAGRASAGARSLLQVDVTEILELIEERAGVKLPRRVIGVALSDGVLHVRFAYPRGREALVKPLPLETPTFLFRDEETGEPTALEVLDLNQLLQGLQQAGRGIGRAEPAAGKVEG